MDLSKLSDEDLKALSEDRIQDVSDSGLMLLSGEEVKQARPEPKQPESVVEKMFSKELGTPPVAERQVQQNQQLGPMGMPMPDEADLLRTKPIVEKGVQAAEENPETFGATVGGTLGAIGGLPGSVIGSGVGGFAGNLFRQDRENPEQPASYLEASKEGGKAAAFDLAGGLVLKGAGAVYPPIKKIFMDGVERGIARLGEETAEKATRFARERGVDMVVPPGSGLTKGLDEASVEVEQSVELALREANKLISNQGREAAAKSIKDILEGGKTALSTVYQKGLENIGLDKYTVNTQPIKSGIMKKLEQLSKRGVNREGIYKSPEANKFVEDFMKETSDDVGADLLESIYISRAKDIQRSAKKSGDGALVGEMSDVISKMETALGNSVSQQGGADTFKSLTKLRDTYSKNVNDLNIKYFRKIADDPKKIYGAISDSKSAREFASALRAAQRLDKSITPSQVKQATDEAASILLEKKLTQSVPIDLNVGEFKPSQIKSLNKRITGVLNDEEMARTFRFMGASKQYKELKELGQFTEAISNRLYNKMKGISSDTRQMGTDLALAAVTKSPYAYTRLFSLSIPFASKRIDLIPNIKRWQRRVVSGEIGGDAAINLAEQMVGQDFVEYMEARSDEQKTTNGSD